MFGRLHVDDDDLKQLPTSVSFKLAGSGTPGGNSIRSNANLLKHFPTLHVAKQTVSPYGNGILKQSNTHLQTGILDQLSCRVSQLDRSSSLWINGLQYCCRWECGGE